jgi:hypothetical protein
MSTDHLLSNDLLEALDKATTLLDRQKIAYALIGGVAASYRSQPRFTRDIDFLVQVPQVVLPRLLDELKSHGFEFDTIATIAEWTEHHMVTLSYRGVRVDWLKPLIPMYIHILDRATNETWLNRTIRVASTEGLILLKLLAYRLQDQVDIENLVAAQFDKLDLDWITKEWRSLADDDDPRMRRLLELIVESKRSS